MSGGGGGGGGGGKGPRVRHAFMYRACDEVVESFGSIFFGAAESDGWQRSKQGRRGPPPRRPESQAMRRFEGIGPSSSSSPEGGGDGGFKGESESESPIARLKRSVSHPFAASMCAGWMDNVALWLEFQQALAKAEAMNASAGREALCGSSGYGSGLDSSCLTVRMAEFVSKGDPTARRVVVERFLHFAGALGEKGAVDRALAVFAEHSQKGNAMEKSSAHGPTTGNRNGGSSGGVRGKFLTEADRQEIRRCVASEPLLAAIGGAAPLLPGTLRSARHGP